MHPGTHPILTKSMLEKQCFCWHRFWHDFNLQNALKMSPKWPQNRPKWHPWALRGALGGAMGPTRCLKTDFSPNLAPQMTLKCPQNDPQIDQNGTLGLSGSHLGEPWVPQEAPRPILAPTGSPNEPKIVKNWSQNLKIKHQSINASKKGGRRHWRSHQIL